MLQRSRGTCSRADPVTTAVAPTRLLTVATDVTLTATVGTSSVSTPVLVQPPSLDQLDLGIQPVSVTGGLTLSPILSLHGSGPAGAVVQITSSAPAAIPAKSITVPAGNPTDVFTLPSNSVAVSTPVTIMATWRGQWVQASLTVTPSRPSSSWLSGRWPSSALVAPPR